MYGKLCGDTTFKNVVLVTNMWGMVSRQVGETREKQLPRNLFKLALGNGAQMVRHRDTIQSAHEIIRMITRNHPVALSIQRELVSRQKDIIHTAAGGAINQEPDGRTGRHPNEQKRVQEDVMQALKEKDERTRRELEEERRRLQEWMEVRMAEMEQRAKEERERAEIELFDLSYRLRDANDASTADRPKLEQQDLVDVSVTIPIDGLSLVTSYVRVIFRLYVHDC